MTMVMASSSSCRTFFSSASRCSRSLRSFASCLLRAFTRSYMYLCLSLSLYIYIYIYVYDNHNHHNNNDNNTNTDNNKSCYYTAISLCYVMLYLLCLALEIRLALRVRGGTLLNVIWYHMISYNIM